jgi:phage-related protein
MSGTLTWPLTVGPSFSGSSARTTTRTLRAEFGDGYSQRVADGLNSVRDVWTVAFENLTEAEYTSARDFLRQQQGTASFFWTPPGETVARRWVCEEWTTQQGDPGAYSLNTTFTEVFDL